MAPRPPISRPPGARPGGEPPWAALGRAGPRPVLGLDAVRRAVEWAGAPGSAPKPARSRASAVLVAVFEEGRQAHVVLTRRSPGLRWHAGEVSFPGGGIEPGEGAVTAALREAHEEVGLHPADVEVLGRLPPVTTSSLASWITPVVGALVGRPTLRPSPGEVDHVFAVSLAELMAEGVYREERWDGPAGPDRPVHFFEVAGEVVWGATARILHHLLELTTAGPAPDLGRSPHAPA